MLRVEGTVRDRPEGTVNPDLPTGAIEIAATRVELLNRAEPPPIPIDDRVDADEVKRLRYRYLDLRSPRLQRNLHLRATVNQALRAAMEQRGFTEIETPILIASTPEGARDFVVPSRLAPGSFYALPQSPQLLKQLLMVGGIRPLLPDRPLPPRRGPPRRPAVRVRAARRRDELRERRRRDDRPRRRGAQGDRRRHRHAPAPPRRLTCQEAMDRYGTDKPDLRIAVSIVDVSAVLADHRGPRVPGAETVQGLVRGRRRRARPGPPRRAGGPGQGARRGRAGVDAGPRATARCESPVAKFLTDTERAGAPRRVRRRARRPAAARGRPDRDRRATCSGSCALEVGRAAGRRRAAALAWVVDFPLFEGIDDEGRPIPAHHPFTMPHPDDLELLETGSGEALLAIRSLSYDLILNGWELGVGQRPRSTTRHSKPGSSPSSASATRRPGPGSGSCSTRSATAPHPTPASACGIDRLVAVLAGEDTIREVIAFPKTQSGADPLTGAPSPTGPGPAPRAGPHRPAPHLTLRPPFRKARFATTLAVRSPAWPTCSAPRSRSASRDGRPSRPGSAPAASTRSSARPHLLGAGKPLRILIESDRLSSVGAVGSARHRQDHHRPARRRARPARRSSRCPRSAPASRRCARSSARARSRLGEHGQGTILFLDEVHRFNRTQQDALLPHVEDGLLVFIGATTENPFFSLTGPLLSRSTPVPPRGARPRRRCACSSPGPSTDPRARRRAPDASTTTPPPASSTHADGDARHVLTSLEVAAALAAEDHRDDITLPTPRRRIALRALRYGDDEHYDVLSAFIKSIRGSDPDAGLYWLARMLEAGEDARLIARRLVILASEDVGLADPRASSSPTPRPAPSSSSASPRRSSTWRTPSSTWRAPRSRTPSSPRSAPRPRTSATARPPPSRPICATRTTRARRASATATGTSTLTPTPAAGSTRSTGPPETATTATTSRPATATTSTPPRPTDRRSDEQSP